MNNKDLKLDETANDNTLIEKLDPLHSLLDIPEHQLGDPLVIIDEGPSKF
jgi:hypothetical protein